MNICISFHNNFWKWDCVFIEIIFFFFSPFLVLRLFRIETSKWWFHRRSFRYTLYSLFYKSHISIYILNSRMACCNFIYFLAQNCNISLFGVYVCMYRDIMLWKRVNIYVLFNTQRATTTTATSQFNKSFSIDGKWRKLFY